MMKMCDVRERKRNEEERKEWIPSVAAAVFPVPVFSFSLYSFRAFNIRLSLSSAKCVDTVVVVIVKAFSLSVKEGGKKGRQIS